MNFPESRVGKKQKNSTDRKTEKQKDQMRKKQQREETPKRQKKPKGKKDGKEKATKAIRTPKKESTKKQALFDATDFQFQPKALPTPDLFRETTFAMPEIQQNVELDQELSQHRIQTRRSSKTRNLAQSDRENQRTPRVNIPLHRSSSEPGSIDHQYNSYPRDSFRYQNNHFQHNGNVQQPPSYDFAQFTTQPESEQFNYPVEQSYDNRHYNQ